jgi:hypothetical protein
MFRAMAAGRSNKIKVNDYSHTKNMESGIDPSDNSINNGAGTGCRQVGQSNGSEHIVSARYVHR